MIALFAVLMLAAAPPAEPAPLAANGASGTATGARPPPPTHVEADHIEYRYKEHETVMTGNPLVRLTRENAVLVCRRLVAENDEAGEIQHAVCEGDVKLTRGDRVVTCKRATYEASSSRVFCRGDPVLHDGESVMTCDELVYDLDRDVVELTRPKGTIVQKPGQPLPVKKKGASNG